VTAGVLGEFGQLETGNCDGFTAGSPFCGGQQMVGSLSMVVFGLIFKVLLL
jgi:hypothetical protein